MVLEILWLNTLLKIFKKSSLVKLMTEALKPLLILLNHYRSQRLYSIAIVFANFDHNLKHLGVVLEILSLTTLLKIFRNSSIGNLMTETLKPLLILLNYYQSRRLYSIAIVFADFDHNLKHLGVVLEILLWNTLLKIFQNDSIVKSPNLSQVTEQTHGDCEM